MRSERPPMPPTARKRCRRCIAGLLWAGGGLTIVVAVAGLLWAVLSAARDAAGSAGAKGVFLTAAVLWGLNFVALVVASALCQLVEDDGESPPGKSDD